MTWRPPQSVLELSRHLDEPIAEGSDLWHLWRRACADSLYFFVKVVMCSTIPPELNLVRWRTHGPICLLMEHDELRNILIEYPRKHMKSTIVTAGWTIWLLLRKVVAGDDPNDRIAILSGTKRNAERHWHTIKEVFDHNDFFRSLFPDLRPSQKWNESLGKVVRQWDRKEPTWEPLAKKAAGKHYDVIVCDDLIDEENYDSPDAVENAITLFRMTNNLLEGPDSRLIVVGNRWAMNDLNAIIHEEAEQTGFSILSVSAETGPEFSGENACVNLPDDVVSALHDLADFAEKNGCIWPERLDAAALARLRAKLGPSIYPAQYLNRPWDPEATDFDVSKVRTCRVEQTPSGPVLHLDNETLPFSSLNLYVTWDPALGGKRARSANAIAVTFTAPPREGDTRMRVGILREHVRKEDPRESIDKFLAFCRLYSPWLHSSGIEEVLFQRVLKDLLRDRAEVRHVRLALRKLKTPRDQSKDQRIRAWLGDYIDRGLFYVEQSCRHAWSQIRLFGTEGAPRDLIDIIAYATQLWVPPLTQDEIEEEEWEDAEASFSRGITGYGSTLAL